MTKKRRYFGTDGIRGIVGVPPITVDFILRLGCAVGSVFSSKKGAKVVIGKDTRISGYMIESALQAGLSASGTNVYLLGPMPTSAIAYFTRTTRADAGIVISASHNKYDNNGIKFFSSEGYKLPDEIELAIEAALEEELITTKSEKLGKALRIHDASGRYIEYCKSCVPHNTNLEKLKIVMDCANGATYHIAPDVFSELGANVIPINNLPNGININDKCGTNYPDVIRKHVLAEKADLGIAFDGDGDRVLMVDDRGEILDGDDLLYIITRGLIASKHFTGGIVGTYMSNLGLEQAITDLGLAFIRVPVGDQNVIEALLKKGWLLGGEPSGHIIYLHVNTTDDGIIAALQVMQALLDEGKSLHDMKKEIKKFPQRIINIPYDQKIDLEDGLIAKAVKQAEHRLGHLGRVLLRYSGTEPVIRVMVEGENSVLVDEIVDSLSDTITSAVKQSI